MEGVEACELLRQEIRSYPFHRRQPYPAGRFSWARSKRLGDRQGYPFDSLRRLQQPVAVVRQNETVRLAIEDLYGEIPFEFGNPPAYSGVVNLQSPRRGHESAMPRQLQEECQVVPVKHTV
jgi:hypothetical protein